jgi:hypothetical protein
MNKIKLLLIMLLFTVFSNTSFSEEKVECKDIKKYFKRMACFSKAAKNKISSKIPSSKHKSKKEVSKEATPSTEVKKEEQIECKDIKKYFKRMACFSKAAKNKIGSKMTSSKEGVNKILKKEQ